MGRLKKYLTLEEKLESRNKASHKYYWNNKEKCDEQQRERDKQKRNKKKMP